MKIYIRNYSPKISNMIIVKLGGGLGNQMFQYATAKALSVTASTELKLDISHFERKIPKETPRNYRLDIFPNIKESIASKYEINKLIRQFNVDFLNKVYKNFNIKILNFNKKYIPERSILYSPIALNGKRSIYLDGYWQSEKYFDTVSNVIQECFNLDFLYHHENLQPFIDRIQQEISVSIHVRRGDYATYHSNTIYHEIADLNYYKKAITRISETVSGNLTFFIFSDDIPWCKKNLVIPFKHIFINTGEEYHDLFLMSNCRHHIIPNSSFSWWAAWLNRRNDKTIIAPKRWFVHQPSTDIIPFTWLTE